MLGLIFKSIYNHRIKNILVAIGVIIGSFAVTTVISVGTSGSEQLNALMSSMGLNGIIISAQSAPYLKQNNIFSTEDIDYLLKNNKSVESAMPIITDNASFGVNGNKLNGYIFGLNNNTNALAAITLKYGTTFSEIDINTLNDVCMVDTDMAKALFGRENIIGKKIDVYVDGILYKLTVNGVISSESPIGTIIESYADNVVFLPYTTVCKLSNSENFGSIALSVGNNADTELIVNQLSDYKDSVKLSVQNMAASQEQMQNAIDWITGILTAVAAVSVIVGGTGIMSVMLSGISERKKEIGIKLAIGALPKSIRREFILEAIIISFISGIIGIILSVPAVKIIGRFINLDLYISPIIIIFALLFCCIIGIIFSVYPANKASQLNPIECLRNE